MSEAPRFVPLSFRRHAPEEMLRRAREFGEEVQRRRSVRHFSGEPVDPAVIDVDWSVDGVVVAAKGGTGFDLAQAGLSSGEHVISAKAYDNAGEDLVKYRDAVCPDSVESWYCHSTGWANATQTVEWTVTVP